MKKVLLVNGSPHRDGHTKAKLEVMEKVFQEEGLEVVWFQLDGDKPVYGCSGCYYCRSSETFRCVHDDDQANELAELMLAADGIVVGTPTYFAGPNGALCALMDRVFSCICGDDNQMLAGKPATAVAVGWRAGTVSAQDRINRYFTKSRMPVATSEYWNDSLLCRSPEDMVRGSGDKYADQVMTTLAHDMAHMIKVL